MVRLKDVGLLTLFAMFLLACNAGPAGQGKQAKASPCQWQDQNGRRILKIRDCSPNLKYPEIVIELANNHRHKELVNEFKKYEEGIFEDPVNLKEHKDYKEIDMGDVLLKPEKYDADALIWATMFVHDTTSYEAEAAFPISPVSMKIKDNSKRP